MLPTLLIFLTLCLLSLLLMGGAVVLAFMVFPVQVAERLVNWGDNPITRGLASRNPKVERERQIRQRARAAMAWVDANPHTSAYILTDVGLLAYLDKRSPARILRGGAIPLDYRFVRPFIEVKARQGGKHIIRLALVDSSGQPAFLEDIAHSGRGKTRLTAQTWLPVEKVSNPRGQWFLTVQADDQSLGAVAFSWEQPGDNELLQQLQTDGEITAELYQVVEQGRFARMSLDDLLRGQGE